VEGTQLSSKQISSIQCWISEASDTNGESIPRRFRIVDKHGLNHYAYNLQLKVSLEGSELLLGLDDARLSATPEKNEQALAAAQQPGEPDAEESRAATAEEMFDDLASLLQKRKSSIAED